MHTDIPVPSPALLSDTQITAESAANVYTTLAIHQRSEEWSKRQFLAFLQEWSDRFAVQFELDVPEIALSVDVLPVSRLGHFRPGHNGFGLRGEIAINATYVATLAQFEILGVLLHELLHAWQHVHGKPSDGSHHNEEFRAKAAGLGLLIGRRGVMGYAAAGPFRDLLAQQGISVPPGEIAPCERRAKGQSKNIKYSCGCTNVACATALSARCSKCHQDFQICNTRGRARQIQIMPDPD